MKKYNPVIAGFSSFFMGMSGTDRFYYGDYGYGAAKLLLFVALFITAVAEWNSLRGFRAKWELVQLLGTLIVIWWIVDAIQVASSMVTNGRDGLFGKQVVYFT